MNGTSDRDYEAYEPEPARAVLSRGQRIVNIIGAVGSVALVLGLIYWGWELAVRDVRGVPVVRAMEGPMRVAPETPGGQVVDHQGLAVNDVAARDGGRASESVVLAPPPVALTLEDAPGIVNDPDAGAKPTEPPAPLIITQEDAVNAALAEALAAEEIGPEGVVDQVTFDDAGNPPPPNAITRSPRPQTRPAGGAATTTVAEYVPAPVVEMDAANIAAGTRLVQFGAFETAELARDEWKRVAQKLGPLMAGKAMVVQKAESNGHTFWRLRGHGFQNEDDARRFCTAAISDGVNCIPVAHR